MMFIVLNNLLNISMIFKYVLFNDFDSMSLSSLYKLTRPPRPGGREQVPHKANCPGVRKIPLQRMAWLSLQKIAKIKIEKMMEILWFREEYCKTEPR